MKRLPVTGSNQLLDLLDPYIPDDFINAHWNVRPVRGPRWQFSAAQLWRVHLLPLLTPVHSLNLLTQLLPEQRAWRDYVRLRHRHRTPDVRILSAFRARMGVTGLRQINEAMLQPLLQTAALWTNATAPKPGTQIAERGMGTPRISPSIRLAACSPPLWSRNERAASSASTTLGPSTASTNNKATFFTTQHCRNCPERRQRHAKGV